MQISQIVVTVLITVVIVAAIIFATAVSLFPRNAEAHAFAHWHGPGSGSRWHPNRSGGGHRDHCARLDMPIGRLANVMLDEHLGLDEAQRKQLEPLTATLDAWRQEARTQCDAFDHTDVAAALVATETMLRTSAERVAALQPAWSAFHASLDATQQAKLAQLLQHRHGPVE